MRKMRNRNRVEALLSESVVASARALLIAKGLEAKGREEVIDSFAIIS